MTTTVAEPELEDVLRSLGYVMTPAAHCQQRITRAGLCCLVGHDDLIWSWLHFTGQFTCPKLLEVRR